jgi:hypothetical protein
VRASQVSPLAIPWFLHGILRFLGGFNSPRIRNSDFSFRIWSFHPSQGILDLLINLFAPWIDTYIPSPRAHPHGKGKQIVGASDTGTTRDEIEEEDDGDNGDDGEEKEEVFDVEESRPPSYVDMGPLMLATKARLSL